MNWYWPLAFIVGATLLFAYCTYSADQASEDFDRALESFDNQACYEAGYNAGLGGQAKAPVSEDSEDCNRWLEAGFADGLRQYEVYEGLLGD